LVSLAVIGELRNPAAMARLLDLIQAPLPPEGLPQADVTRTPRTLAKMVRARAVQALAFLRTPTALSHTKNIAATHASRLIRAAAIDAFMFNRRNSAAARDELMAVVRPEEQRFIGLARKADVVDAASLAAFEQKISDYYATYPEELP
jgi:HEAT repeat protein